MAVINDVMPAFELFQPHTMTTPWRYWPNTARTLGCWPEASIASIGSRTASSGRKSLSISARSKS